MIAVATKSRLRRISNIARAYLAAGDLMVGVVVQPLFMALAITTLQSETSSQACSTQTATKLLNNFFFIFISLAHLVIMSGDRYLAIKHPYTYNNVVTAFRMLLAAAIGDYMDFRIKHAQLVVCKF